MREVVMRSKVSRADHAEYDSCAQIACAIRMAELATTDLRILREIAQTGSFTAAAGALGYTQSAISRRAAALERAAGRTLFERRRSGVHLTPAGDRLLARAAIVLAELDAARRELEHPTGSDAPVRLGAFASAVAALVPAALSALSQEHPGLEVTLREGTTPALVRALRAGAIDLAVLAASPPFRPFDAEAPALLLDVISEADLLVAVGPHHRFGARTAVELAELEGERWIASRSDVGETLLGVWPGLSGRPNVAYTVRDWLSKLGLVASGVGVTTVPAILAPALPPGIHLLAVRGEPQERRRVVLVRLPGQPATPAVTAVADALRAAAAATGR
jgi:DNA-binding transcriptional LysR family regulator